MIAWDMIKQYTQDIPGIKKNESELRVDFTHNNSRIQLFGADNPDALRGLGLHGVVFDEYSQQPATIFTEVVSKCLADNLGYAVWIGTPKGKNEFHRLYEQSKLENEWMGVLLTVDDSIENEQGETIANLAQAVKDDQKLIEQGVISRDEFLQEWYCSFDAAIKGAYYSKDLQYTREQNRVSSVPHQTNLTVDTWWDLGISDTTVIVFTQTVGKQIHIIDYYENNGYGLEHYTRYLQDKIYMYGTHNLPHDVNVRELGTGRSRYEVLQSLLGRDKIKVVKNVGVKDGIEAVRAIFSRCWFDKEKTAFLLDALGSYTQEWDDKKGMFRDKPLHNWASHPADAMRMLGVGYRDRIISPSKGYGMKKYKQNQYGDLNKTIKKLKL